MPPTILVSSLTATDVAKVAPQIGLLSSTTKPSAEYVETVCIPDAEREVDAVLRGLGYNVDDWASWTTDAQRTACELVRWRAAVPMLMARGIAAGNPEDQGVLWAQKEYERRKKALMDPDDPTEIVGATRTGKAVEKDHEDLSASWAETADACDLVPVITRDTVF